MEKRLLSGNVAEDFHTFFSNMHGMNTGEMVAKIFALFNHITQQRDQMQLVAVWRMLDFFAAEIPKEEAHRIKAIRQAIIDRLGEIGYTWHARLAAERKHI